MQKEIFELGLGINEPWYITEIAFDIEQKRLDIYMDFRTGTKFSYAEEEENTVYPVYDTEEKEWRHLNFFEHECYLHARVPRVKLHNGYVIQIKTPWEGLARGFTLLFEALIVQLCTAMLVLKVEKLTGVSDDKLWSVLDKYIEKGLKIADHSKVKTIGMDETSRAKGHNYITLFVDMEEKRTTFITEGKGSETVAEFKNDLEKHKGKAENIEQVSCDMSTAFIKGVNKNLPNAEITFDKFHVSKVIHEAVDEVRRQEAKEQPILKNTRYIFLKRPVNLTIKQKETLDTLRLAGINLKTMKAYQIKENFQAIYNIANDKESFERLLKKWFFWATHSRLEPIKEAAYTIKRHWDGVVNWIESLINNGILEGLNSIIQAAKAKARGYRTTKNFMIIAYLLTGKLELEKLNYAYKPI